MMTNDINFDDKAHWFQRRIYGGMKGTLRLDALWGDILGHLPAISSDRLMSVWDAGNGLGQMSCKLAGLGHRVLLNDISTEMLGLAGQEIDRAGLKTIDIRQSSIQNQAAEGQSFDLIVFHTVLEWLSEPQATLESLLRCLKPDAYLSLAVYNVNTVIMINVLKGDLNKALSGDHGGHMDSLPPTFATGSI
jgi:S-adenosylmethionine-dependent methyltransferase